ncbi:MAG: hypothetical protein EOO24_06645 [Comamonadaceae bacterium]|nr:MAG: hypothetical protein EOO24_06645 [Comamonadaceae bacterium]
MTDPRNVAHDKKVLQEKKHRHEETAATTHAVQPGKKPHLAPAVEADVPDPDTPVNGEPAQG